MGSNSLWRRWTSNVNVPMNQRAPVPKPSWRLLFAIVLVSIALELRATAAEPEAPAPVGPPCPMWS